MRKWSVVCLEANCPSSAHHPVNDGRSRRDEEDLHQSVVKGNIGEEEIEITTAEYYKEENLCFERHPPAAASSFDPMNQHDKADKMQHICSKSEDVHRA